MEDEREDADDVESADEETADRALALERQRGREGRFLCVEARGEGEPCPPPAEGCDVVKDEDEAEVAGEALECVAEVLRRAIFSDVGRAGGGVVDAEDRVETDGEPDAQKWDGDD